MSQADSIKPGVFLSHTARDKPFVRRLATDLVVAGARVWIDEAEIGIGDSLISKISEGIDNTDYLAVILSTASVGSEWVQRELDVALNQEIQGRRVKVLPLLLENCPLPAFLLGKKYADFTDPDNYVSSLGEVLARLGLIGEPSIGTYHQYPFREGPRRFRDLSERAKLILRQLAHAQPDVIVADWQETTSPRQLRSLKIGIRQLDIGDGEQGDAWYTALQDLEKRWLIQAVGSRPGYVAYKLTPDGWDLVKFLPLNG